MELKKGDAVTAVVKATEVMIDHRDPRAARMPGKANSDGDWFIHTLTAVDSSQRKNRSNISGV